MTAAMTEKLNTLFKNNEDFCIRYFDAIDNIDLQKKVLKDYDVVITDEELEELNRVSRTQMAKMDKEELLEEDLDEVAGGLVGWVIAGVVGGIIVGYGIYKLRKTANGYVCR